tara:strand:+ start:245 stop:514 length:270 start_codon:yes stop_codon:yes gene_type:complete
MAKLKVGQITGLSPQFTTTIPEETDLLFAGTSNLVGNQYIPFPYGTVAQFEADKIQNAPRRELNGMMRYDTANNEFQVYLNGKWHAPTQ